ncbi:hypothetical protein [Dysosmobacter sp.]|uniref:hypothetical protein n=1 Tax=Dysosmobacter sp. TaxID=2591382 RepID=UPI002AA09823|nr:hypothetical protein [Dysosmobacter sp.]MDY5612605.1 hypothetical protein [Dysosmobacter sp.]
MFLLLAVLLNACYQLLATVAGAGGSVWGVVRIMYLILLVISVSMAACAFPLLSNSLRLSFRHLLRMVAAEALTATAVALTVLFWYYGGMLLTPALCALLSAYLLEHVFRKYTPEEKLEEDMEHRGICGEDLIACDKTEAVDLKGRIRASIYLKYSVLQISTL